jgi:sugar phosphate isomerase/epimerase
MPNLLSVSSLAWDASEDALGFALLSELAVPATELIPARVEQFGVDHYQRLLAQNNLRAVAMQSIFFGSEGLHLLRDQEAFERLADHVEEVAAVASELEIPLGIFGAPALRSFTGGNGTGQESLGMERLRQLDRRLQACDFKLAIEPVPEAYGCDFLTTSTAIAECLSSIDASHLVLMLDTACIELGGADLRTDVQTFAPQVPHVHVSEPNIGAFGTPAIDHVMVAEILAEQGYNGPLSIEMRRQEQDWQGNIRQAIAQVRESYAPVLGGRQPCRDVREKRSFATPLV